MPCEHRAKAAVLMRSLRVTTPGPYFVNVHANPTNRDFLCKAVRHASACREGRDTQQWFF